MLSMRTALTLKKLTFTAGAAHEGITLTLSGSTVAAVTSDFRCLIPLRATTQWAMQ